MTGAVISGLVAGYGVAIPVGAIAIVVLSLTARAGLRVGAAAALGVASADGLYAAVAVAGGAASASVVRLVATPLRLIAGMVLLALAVRTAMQAWRRHAHPATAVRPRGAGLARPGRAYLSLLGLTALNPATVIYFSALVLGTRAGALHTLGGGIAFATAAFVASASWQLLLATGGAALGRVLTSPRGQLVTGLVSAVLIAVLGLSVALSEIP